MIRLAIVATALTAAGLAALDVLALALSAVTGNLAYVRDFWTLVLVILISLAAVFVLAVAAVVTAWLLLSDRSPIPAVRARWTRHLIPVRAASQTARCAATTQNGAQS